MSDYANYKDYILDKLDERALLEQLAEEASELSQAALKLIRAKGLNNNNTPVGEQEAMLSLALEYMDLLMVYSMLLEKDRKILNLEHVRVILFDELLSKPHPCGKEEYRQIEQIINELVNKKILERC